MAIERWTTYKDRKIPLSKRRVKPGDEFTEVITVDWPIKIDDSRIPGMIETLTTHWKVLTDSTVEVTLAHSFDVDDSVAGAFDRDDPHLGGRKGSVTLSGPEITGHDLHRKNPNIKDVFRYRE